MAKICLYFNIHKPFLLKQYKVFDVGHIDEYFDEHKSKETITNFAGQYSQTNQILKDLFQKHSDKFKVAFSISGTTLELMEKYSPETLKEFQNFSQSDAEYLAETYYHSLSFLYSKKEFQEQIKLHIEAIKKYFNQTPQTFRNTHLIYSDEIAEFVKDLEMKNILLETNSQSLNFKNTNSIYSSGESNLNLFIKNNELSEEVTKAIQAKDKEKISSFISKISTSEDEIINLYLNYDILENQLALSNFKLIVEELMKTSEFILPKESKLYAKEDISIPLDMDHLTNTPQDLNLWMGNKMQKSICMKIYEMESEVKKIGGKTLDSWRKFTTSDNFYFLKTNKTSHPSLTDKLLHIYEGPYDTYTYFINALQDFLARVGEQIKTISSTSEPLIVENKINDDN